MTARPLLRGALRALPLAAFLTILAPAAPYLPGPAGVALDVVAGGRLHAQAGEDARTVVFVVRHGERAEDGTDDPPISEAGGERARHLAAMMRDADLTHLHTTDLQRTRATLAPTAEETGLEPRLYDPSDVEAFARRLRETPGRHLVVGHSNTNPELVEALGGDPMGPIEEMEYDRGYVVVVLPDGYTGSSTFRFGEPFGAEASDPGEASGGR